MDSCYWFVFYKDEILMTCGKEGCTIPQQTECPVPLQPWNHVHHVASLNGIDCMTVEVDKLPELNPDLWLIKGLRASYYDLPQAFYLMAGKCAEIIYWDKNTQYCGVCGAPMQKHTDISKRCTQCGKEVWPQLATAVIVLVSRGDEVLLVHARNFKKPFYGLVAGFVETGETLEQAVQRELMEETGITVTNIRYFSSQPWPYPCGLMVGFTADYVAGDIHLQQEELARGGWFNAHHLPMIPEKLSIARRLIDHWLSTKGILQNNDNEQQS